METAILTKRLCGFCDYLKEEEKSENTIKKYFHDIKVFLTFLGDRILSKEILLEWKRTLVKGYAPASVNSMLAAINSFLEWGGLLQYRVKPLKIQREIFAKPEKELTREEYLCLIKAARDGKNKRLALIIQTIGSTGIRVSELKSITVSAVNTGRATVTCKGKTRIVFLPKELCRALSRYCREERVESGVVFCTKNKKPLDRTNIWRDMKSLCRAAGVEESKIFPHNLRHLFARTYYRLEKDLSRLADLLGHSSVSTTRIYTMESGSIHEKQLERMNLVVCENKKTT